MRNLNLNSLLREAKAINEAETKSLKLAAGILEKEISGNAILRDLAGILKVWPSTAALEIVQRLEMLEEKAMRKGEV